MSIKALAWAWDQVGLTAAEKLILLALADHADDSGECYPGTEGIADKTGVHKITVHKVTRTLAEKGLLTKSPRKRKDGGNSASSYQLRLTRPQGETSQRLVGGASATLGGASVGLGGGGKKQAVKSLPATSSKTDSDANRHLTVSTTKPSSADAEAVLVGPNGKPATIGSMWCDLYRDAFMRTYRITGRDAAAIKELNRLYASGPSQIKLCARMTAYLEDQDPWLLKQGHPLYLLPSRLNKYSEKTHEPEPPAPWEDEQPGDADFDYRPGEHAAP